MSIVIQEVASGETTTFPMMPEEIKLESSAEFGSYKIMNAGNVQIPLGEDLLAVSWSGRLPGEYEKQAAYVLQWQPPKTLQGIFSKWRNRGILLRLMISGTPIDHDMYLESYRVTYAAAGGSYTYDIKFVQARPLKVMTETPTASQAQNTSSDNKAKEVKDTPAQSKYVVKSGDTLSKIAESTLGDAGRYLDIAELNNIDNHNYITVGQVLMLPEV